MTIRSSTPRWSLCSTAGWTTTTGCSLDVATAAEIGGFRYVFTHDNEQLVLDVRT